mmetsp:Transcript_110128/g.225084  ORF Transcript_110128/g.225084 Transcript_110128/m.225084 type:complete len:80 (-) Transcript_110128:1282-1521(-)
MTYKSCPAAAEARTLRRKPTRASASSAPVVLESFTLEVLMRLSAGSRVGDTWAEEGAMCVDPIVEETEDAAIIVLLSIF